MSQSVPDPLTHDSRKFSRHGGQQNLRRRAGPIRDTQFDQSKRQMTRGWRKGEEKRREIETQSEVRAQGRQFGAGLTSLRGISTFAEPKIKQERSCLFGATQLSGPRHRLGCCASLGTLPVDEALPLHGHLSVAKPDLSSHRTAGQRSG